MYNDGGTFDNLFTGQEVGGEWVYPTARQNAVVKFSDFYLSAMEGDFTTDGLTFSTQTGDAVDITIGNAPAAVLNATMLNPDNKMGALTWGDGTVYIGCETTATAAADTYQSYPVHVLAGSVHYGINSSGNARRNTTNYTLGGTPVAVISNAAGTDVLFITDTKIGRYNGSFSVVTTPSAEQEYMAAKFRAMPYTVGVLLDADGCPNVYNSVELDTKLTIGYVPMGIFDFSNVDAFGVTFGVEAYDKMTLFDADCTDWWNTLDFDNGGSGRRLDWLADEVCQHFGFSTPAIGVDAVNTSLVWDTNPITSYAVTGRDIMKWLAEAMGCNVRMGRTGGVEFWTIPVEIASPPTPVPTVATITPDTIIGNTRVKGKATVPKMTETICYNVLGAGYEVGSSGSPYYVVANPFIDPSADLTSLTAINSVVTGIPAYYPNTISVACADPRWDAGDFVMVTNADGSPQYAVPIMHEALAWKDTCVAVLSATGKQVRDIPTSMLNTDLSTMVDSNPSAVVNKIAAHGIDADWITAGTISDRNHLNTWDLDTGDLAITTGKIQTTYTKTYYYADYDASDITRITQIRQGQVTPTDADYEKYDIIGIGQINFASQNRVQQIINTQTNLVKTVTTVIDPSAYEYAIKITTDVPAVGTAQAFNYSTLYSGPKIKAYTYEGSTFKGGSFQGALGGYFDGEEVYLYDGTYTKTITASGPTITRDTNSSTVTQTSGTSFQELASFTISEAGTYLITSCVRYQSNSTGRRVCNLSLTSASSSPVGREFTASAAAVNGAETVLNICAPLKINNPPVTIYLNAYQNSGSSLTVIWVHSYVRLA